MVNRGISDLGRTSLFLTLCLAGASTVAAQNVIPNPEFNNDIVAWSSGSSTASWDSVDSRGCLGSGELKVPCVFSDELQDDDCLPYSALTARIAYNLRASADVPGSEQFGLEVEAFSDTECQTSILGFPVLVGQIGDVPTTNQTFEGTQVLPVGTQSIKVGFLLSDNNCAPDTLFYLDALYYGEAQRIFSHDFENGDACPFVKSP